MNKLPMSRAASALLRALIHRSGADQDRILLIEIQSVDWQSLTLTGERHVIHLRLPGPDADSVARSLTFGLDDAEFTLTGLIVADIAVAGEPRRNADGSMTLSIEALTIAE